MSRKYTLRQFVTAESRECGTTDWEGQLRDALNASASAAGYEPVGEPQVSWHAITEENSQDAPESYGVGDWEVRASVRLSESRPAE